VLPPRPARRALIPALVAAEVVLVALFALMSLVGLVLVPFSRRRRVVRIGAMGVAYLGVELAALTALGWVALRRRSRPEAWWEDANARVLAWALGVILGAGARCVGFVVEVDDSPHTRPAALDDADPLLVLARHGGPGDSVALVWLLLERYGRVPRVVLKEVLQWEPLLDVALNRLGACFLPPAAPAPNSDGPAPNSDGLAPNSDGLAPRVGALAADLRGRDALLLFPEGGNWTARRRIRAIRKLWAHRQYRAARAAVSMPHVLPPRPAGVLACLDARPDLAVVVAAHTGLDTLTTAGQIYGAIPFERPMTVRWWQARPAPRGEEARLEWLTAEWAVVDEWIAANKPAGRAH
jgi:1-acyl-sn-glycerol-3-phosphate acyltransferase